MKTKEEIIKETAAFYNLNNRGMSNDGGCIYLNEDTGNKCALGRCMTDEALLRWGDYADNAESLSYSVLRELKGTEHGYNRNSCLDSILKEEYRGHSLMFWTDVQCFHDNSGYWDEDGINSFGQHAKDELIVNYSQSSN